MIPDERGHIPAARPALAALSTADIDGGVMPRLRTVVSAWPDVVAVLDQRQSLTYADLAGRALAVAAALRESGDAEQPVTLLSSHDAPAVASILGALLSGRPLLVMDPLSPVPRLRGFAERIGTALCLCDAAHEAMAGEVMAAVGGRVLRTPAEAPGPDWAGSALWDSPPAPSSIGVLNFTSGSTGRPKVVTIDQRYLAGDSWAASEATGIVRAGDVMAHTLPLAFAAGMNATVTGALAGVTLAMYDTRALGIGGLADWIDAAGVTMMVASPAILRAFVSAGPAPEKLRALRSLGLSGEAVYGRDVELARTVLPAGCAIYHRFGSTETGMVSELRVDAAMAIPEGRLSIGTATGISRITLVGDDGEPVVDGQQGRMVITRSYLSSGYWGDPERTAEAFWDNGDGTRSFRSNDLGRVDDDGQLYLIGRSDHSVKVRGYLVEPGEVDAVLFAQPDVAEAVTVGTPRPDGLSHRLVTYVVSRAEKPSGAAIRAGLRAGLPGYMVPEVVVFLSALPRNERGKIDRAALPPPPPPVGGQAPITEWESAVAQAWGRVLELEDVPRDADFFELGGDSLAAEALISIVVNDLQVPPAGVTPALLVEAPTVAQFAHRLHRIPGRATHRTLTVLRTDGTRPPLFVVAGGGGLGVGFVALTRHLDDDQPVYALHAHALEHRGIPDWSVGAMAQRHLAAMHSIQPQGPYYLAGHSFGGLVAFEMAQRLRGYGQEVGLLTVLDSFPPDPRLIPSEPALSPLRQVKSAVGLAITGLFPTPGTGQYQRFHRQSMFLSRRYSPSVPYPGRTLVLVADSAERDSRAQWPPHLSGDWELVTVRGDHHSFLREPHVADVAGLLTEHLAQAQSQRV